MRIRTLFIVLAAVLAAGWIMMFPTGPRRHITPRVYLYEAFGAAMAVYLVYFYRKVVAPMNLLSGGLDMLRTQNLNSTLRHVGQQETDSIVDVFNSMLDKLREQRLRNEEQSYLLAQIMETSASGIVIVDPGGIVEMANMAAVHLTGGMIGKGVRLDGSGGETVRVMAAMAPGDERTLHRADSNVVRIVCRHFIDRGINYRFFMLDNLTETIIRAEREGYQKMIRIISHEVNNSVGTLASSLDTIASLHDEEGNEGREMAGLLRSYAHRASGLCAFVSRYADVVKIPAPVPVATDAEMMLDRCMPFLESIASQWGVPVIFDIRSPLPPVMADTPLLEQVMVNIVKNAAESIGRERPDGMITVTAEECDGRLAVTVTDNGAGIDRDKSSRLFTPFFTDKPGGHGLGLLMVRDILRGHNAEFSLATDPDDGLTRFTILFPRSVGDR